MKISLETINNEIIKPVIFPIDTRKIKGRDICEEPYANFAIIAKKKSGKTQALFHILKKCAGKNTTIYAFVSTLYKDKTYKAMRKYFAHKDIEFIGYQSMKDDEGNILEGIVEDLQAKAEKEDELDSDDESDQEEEAPTCHDLYEEALRIQHGDPEPERKEKQKKPKYIAPDYIFVFDDLSHELKSPALVQLLKSNRHYKCKTIISTQYIHDAAPEQLKQMDIWLIFKGQPLKKLEKIYLDADVSIPFDLFVEIYKKATEKKYNFLYIDTRTDSFRRNFTDKFRIPEEDIENDNEFEY